MNWLRVAVEEDVKVDIVYLDPMFPSSKHKSALPKRRMQWLREYLGPSAAATPQAEQEELQQLLDAAKRVAKKVTGGAVPGVADMLWRWSSRGQTTVQWYQTTSASTTRLTLRGRLDGRAHRLHPAKLLDMMSMSHRSRCAPGFDKPVSNKPLFNKPQLFLPCEECRDPA